MAEFPGEFRDPGTGRFATPAGAMRLDPKRYHFDQRGFERLGRRRVDRRQAAERAVLAARGHSAEMPRSFDQHHARAARGAAS